VEDNPMRLDSVQISKPISIVPELEPTNRFVVGNFHESPGPFVFFYHLTKITLTDTEVILEYVRREEKSAPEDGFEFPVIIQRQMMVAYVPAFLDHEEK
jgi:hypothetical protein